MTGVSELLAELDREDGQVGDGRSLNTIRPKADQEAKSQIMKYLEGNPSLH